MRTLNTILRFAASAVWGALAGFFLSRSQYALASWSIYSGLLTWYALVAAPEDRQVLQRRLQAHEHHVERLITRNHRLHRRVVRQMAMIEDQRSRLAAEVPDEEVAKRLPEFGSIGVILFELWQASQSLSERAFVKTNSLWAYAQAVAYADRKGATHAD